MGKSFCGPHQGLASFALYKELRADEMAGLTEEQVYMRWVVAMLPHRKELDYYDAKNYYFTLASMAGRNDALAENIAVEMARHEVGWIPEFEWEVHRMRPTLRSLHLRGFLSLSEPKPALATGRPTKYPWDSLEFGQCFTLSPGQDQPKLRSLRVMASRKTKGSGKRFSCKTLDDGSIEVRRVG